MSFDPHFVFYRDPREVLALETIADMSAEAEDELDTRRRLYPHRVRKGRMARADADRELRVMAAIADRYSRPGQHRAQATWAEQVHCLRREIALRRQFYPRWIDAGRVEQPVADRKLRMMESMHDEHWNHDWSDEAIAARAETERKAA